MVQEEMSHTRGLREKGGLENTQRRKRSQKVSESLKSSAQTQSKVLSSFLLALSGLVPPLRCSQILPGVGLESWETMRSGKHHGVGGTRI